jgi:hypothetical protein
MFLCDIHFYAFALKSGYSARAFAAIFFCAVVKVVLARGCVRSATRPLQRGKATVNTAHS